MKKTGMGIPADEVFAYLKLQISHGNSGYLALFEHCRVQNVIRVVAIRHECEAGYRGMP